MKLNTDGAVKYHYGQFPPRKLDYERFVEPLLEASAELARYDQMLKNMHNSEILLAPLRKQEAVISSRMEGTVSTMDEILQYEADHGEDGKGPANARLEVIETFLYQRVLKSAQKEMEQGRPISSSFIRTIHQGLLSYGLGASKSPGKFKTEQNYLADRPKNSILFIPISPEKLQDGVEALLDYLERGGHPPLIKTGIAHIEFEALHPFKDGNGRIGRMLITLMLWRYGLISAPSFYISEYFEGNKDMYIDAMRNVSGSGDWDSWCAFFLEAVKEQAARNLYIAESIRNLYEDMKIVFSGILSSKWSLAALDFLFTNPVFRNNRFTKSSGIPTPTAARMTRILLENELIATKQEASGRRPALYSFEPLMRLVRV